MDRVYFDNQITQQQPGWMHSAEPACTIFTMLIESMLSAFSNTLINTPYKKMSARDDNPDWDETVLRKHSSLNSEERYWSMFTIGVRIALCLHAFFIPLFYLVGSPFLAAVNIGSVLLYTLCLTLIMQRLYLLVMICCWLEIIGHAVLATAAIGWESGFHYYLLVFIPLIFFNTSRRTGQLIIMMTLICAGYMMMDAFMRNAAPMTDISESTMSLLRYANISLSFAFLSFVTLLYVSTVNKAENRLIWHATTDPLTGLFNRRHQMDVIEYEQKQFKRGKKTFSFIIIDIDDFKEVNDIYGHDAGDHVLINVGNILTRTLREQDSTARWGGEEYLVLLPSTKLANAVEIAKRIKQAITSTPTRHGDLNIEVAVTMGISEYREDESIDDCISRADLALYQGKGNGKDRIELAAV